MPRMHTMMVDECALLENEYTDCGWRERDREREREKEREG